MKIFISWSGDRSKALAQALRDWLPLVLPGVEPWLSERDLAAGDRWALEVAKELEATNFGIMCLTPENVDSQWILFEAGALAKSIQDSKVVPLLFNLEFSEISGPLAQFQAKKVSQGDLEELTRSVNQAADPREPDERVRQRFGGLWPDFERRLQTIPVQAPIEKQVRPRDEILEELVTGVRGLESRVNQAMTTIAGQDSGHGMRRTANERVMAVAKVENQTLAVGLGRKPQGIDATRLQFAGALNASANGILKAVRFHECDDFLVERAKEQ